MSHEKIDFASLLPDHLREAEFADDIVLAIERAEVTSAIADIRREFGEHYAALTAATIEAAFAGYTAMPEDHVLDYVKRCIEFTSADFARAFPQVVEALSAQANSGSPLGDRIRQVIAALSTDDREKLQCSARKDHSDGLIRPAIERLSILLRQVLESASPERNIAAETTDDKLRGRLWRQPPLGTVGESFDLTPIESEEGWKKTGPGGKLRGLEEVDD